MQTVQIHLRCMPSHLCYSRSTRHLRTRKALSVGCNLQELRCEAVRSGAKRCEAVRSGAKRCEAVQIARSSAKRCKRCEPHASLVLLAQLAPLAH